MSNGFRSGYALVVGVGADLANTVDDAVGLAGILKDPQRCAYPPTQVHVLTDEQATRTGVLASLDQLAQAADAEATVVVYFSGHGYRVSSSMGEVYYLMPYGYDTQRLYQTAISGVEFTARLAAIPARKLLLLLDCCHAGGVGEAKAAGMALTKAPLPPEALNLLAEGSGRVLIASSRDAELSYAGKPYSAFTLALVEALCGEGVAKQDGTVRVADLALYAREKVPGRTKDRQHPILHFKQADNFAVAYYAGGDMQPKGLPFTVQPEIEPAPGAWRSQTTVYGDQIRSSGPVATHGSAINTGSGVAFVGNRNAVVTGKVGGDVMVNSTKQSGGGNSEDFHALLAELRKQLEALQSQGLGAAVGAEAGAELDQAAELAERDDPPSKRIVRALENVKDILEAAGGAVAATLTLVPLVNQAIQLAQSLFR